MLRPHALRGEMRVLVYSPTARNVQRGRPVYLQGVRRTVEQARADHDQWILKLSGIGGRDAVESLRGELLEAADNDVLRDDDESYFVHELIGLRVVVSADSRELGRVVEVLQTGANDVYVIRGDGGEVLVPAIAEVIDRIDVSGGLISITPLPGLLDESK
ncbi:MAG: 16S rRNA processing protein RimM [Dehalococcoidia bacterium]|nr:16S rRNA processing protein RimM [Dehalococcoidia bacterium]